MDSTILHPSNSSYDFIIELPRAIIGKYQCALMEFSCQESMTEDLYIYSDLCQPELVHDSLLPLLRIVTETGEVNTPYYKDITRQHIQRVHIYIRNRQFMIPTHAIGPVRVVLALEEL